MKSKNYLTTLASAAKTTLLMLSIISLLGAGRGASAASPSELLQKGIYSEETKGDLDSAMQLYQQVVSEAKGAQAVAAQAQYHLGVCYYKKKNYAEATAAFEKLVKDYPEQKELIALAGEYLTEAVSLLPAPWTDGEEMQLDIKFPTGFKFGMGAYAVHAGEPNGQKIWQVSARMFAGVQSFSRVEVDAESLKPIYSRWKHTLIGDAEATYTSGQAEIKMRGKNEVKKIDLNGVVYDNEEAIQMMRCLPLATNYTTSLRFLTSLGGGNIVPVKLEVAGMEKVEVPAGTFECFKVELSIHQTFWYSADAHRYLVKFEAGGVVAELSKVHRLKSGDPVNYQDPSFGFTFTAPPGWIVYRPEEKDDKGKVGIEILDPEAAATSELHVGALENLKAGEKKSPRDWAESEAVDGSKVLKGLKIRPESWQERNVAGHSGVSVIGDFVEGQEKKVAYAVFSFGNTTATEFRFVVGSKDFADFQPRFDAIVDSYKVK